MVLVNFNVVKETEPLSTFSNLPQFCLVALQELDHCLPRDRVFQEEELTS